MAAQTMFDKVWDAHVVADLGDGMQLMHVDRHYLLDLGGARSLRENSARGLRVRNPELTFATPDHLVSTAPGRRGGSDAHADMVLATFRAETRQAGIKLFDIGDLGQGIVHVVGPEQGLTLPGALIVCADSHTCTNGALGAIAFGVGSSELKHVLATQTIVQRKPKTMRVVFTGTTGNGVEAKDLILALIGVAGVARGTGHAVEYTGDAIRSLDVEARMTLCNLSIEWGARIGMVAPDQRTLDYVRGRPFAPQGSDWTDACAHWRGLATDEGARFDDELTIDCSAIAPQVTWGTNPGHVIGVDGRTPSLAWFADDTARADAAKAFDYMGLLPGRRIEGTRVDRVFIGSCTNARLTDLRRAADIARGRRVASHVKAWVVPGSAMVKAEAESEGLDQVFIDAGFEWREPGCSMCVGANGDLVEPGARCVSTSNRNFIGRQGPLARTHLASPTTAAASAIAGEIIDVRRLARASPHR